MPIRPAERARYPKDWRAIRARILARAGDRCEWCGVRNRAWGYRDPGGRFHELRKGPLRDAGYDRPPFDVAATQEGREVILRVIEIVLTIAHLNHTPEDNRDENLAALCQRCHLRHDAAHHARTASRTRVERLEAHGQARLPLEAIRP